MTDELYNNQDGLDLSNELAQLGGDAVANADQVEKEADSLMLNQNKVVLMRKLLGHIKESSEQLLKLLESDSLSVQEAQSLANSLKLVSAETDDAENVIEGVFNGESMIGPDGHEYRISANYASKSKLVEGDMLKLTITKNGTFLYKQIGPVDRSRLVGQLRRLSDNDFVAVVGTKTWKLLNASITYFKGDDGDEVVILVPKLGETRWAAVENIIKK
ncbi:hypothetical protein HGA64_00405 [Candidatus Falkowbacteria bacterium]|nr:hypothetical protein [Candidatus Falkowbacteria bacterium]